MKNFSYINAGTTREALELLQSERERACLIAGGTNVLPLIRSEKIDHKTLINIRNLKELCYITETKGKVLIGSLTTIADIERSETLRKYAPALTEAARHFADPTTRNSATIGGNLANASPAADTAPPLLALHAVVVVDSAEKGEREIPIGEFFLGVNKTGLESNELMTRIEIPQNGANSSSWFIKLGLRNAMAISVVSAAACIEIASGKIKEAGIALGSVAPTPVRAKTVESRLMGKELSAEVIEEAAQAVVQDISPIDDVRAVKEYRQIVAAVMVKRVLKKIVNI
ncbi:FAD binding domain-containing protein [Candidatus Formimonas warabiya]|uniref:FAD-binding PCMH-type domain-containing protein n=1 Tax=Formimonas warabiya TaxID=1761012 RepID=A0A3G1KZ82_FORW1|nr:xanthine dehydrogenase family protein subunit M [Candidatus Formimonas warabiya]ATW27525.1 hypothetical protein DCMF_24690 [Candidatus Formimonas warabiya]